MSGVLFRLSTALLMAAGTYGAGGLAVILAGQGLPLVALLVPLACFWIALVTVTVEAWLGRIR